MNEFQKERKLNWEWEEEEEEEERENLNLNNTGSSVARSWGMAFCLLQHQLPQPTRQQMKKGKLQVAIF